MEVVVTCKVVRKRYRHPFCNLYKLQKNTSKVYTFVYAKHFPFQSPFRDVRILMRTLSTIVLIRLPHKLILYSY